MKTYNSIKLQAVLLTILFFSLTGKTNAQWTASVSPTGGAVYTVATSGSNLYAGSYAAGVFISTNNGLTWASKSVGIITHRVTSIAAAGTNVYAVTAGGGFYMSTNNGNNWVQSNSGIANLNLMSVAVSGSNIYAVSYGGGIFLSTNNGTSWIGANNGIGDPNNWDVLISGANTFACNMAGVYKTTNNGMSWTSTGLSGEDVRKLYKDGTTIYAGANNGHLWVSTNDGANWMPRHIPLTTRRILSIVTAGSKLYAGSEVDGIFMSTNNGMNWSTIGSPNLYVYTFSLLASGSTIFAADGGGLSKTTNDGVNWIKSNDGISSLSIRYFTSAANILYTSIDPIGIFMSTNNGLTWIEKNNGFPNKPYCFAIASIGTNLFTSIFNEGVYKSTNGGSNWTASGISSSTVGSFAVMGTDIYAVTAVVYKSTNNGETWSLNYTGGTGTMEIIHAAGTNLYIGTRTTGVHISTNNGANWAQATSGITSPNIKAFISIGNTVFAGTDTAGVFRTTNNGTNWVSVNNGLPNKIINALEKTGNTVIAATKSGVYYSTNFGESWVNFNHGISSAMEVVSLYNFNNTTLYAGTNGQSLIKRPISDLTGVKEITGSVVDKFVLSQNYPNPFNPSTQINFSIPKQANVTLKVFDVSGKEVARLINGELKNAGHYSAQFSKTELSSGIYFYVLKAGEFTATKKMMLLK